MELDSDNQAEIKKKLILELKNSRCQNLQLKFLDYLYAKKLIRKIK